MSRSPAVNQMRKSEVGEIRPSQVLHTFGIGSIVDLPNLSALMMGIDDWPVSHSNEINEQRLLQSVQGVLGPQVARLLTPPKAPESRGSQSNWFDDSHTIGVPVAPFPRWMVCSACRLLAPISSGFFEPKIYPYRPDKTCYLHTTCQKSRKPALVVPARFVVACKRGHLDDFPWLDFVHRDKKGCPGPLTLYEIGASGEAADVQVACEVCKSGRRMAEAFGRDNEVNMPECRGRRPHLRDFDPNGCDTQHVTPILQGASNSWFPVMLSVLSVPPQATDNLGQIIDENWAILEETENLQNVKLLRKLGHLKDFVKDGYTDDQIWSGVETKRAGGGDVEEDSEDLKTPEWNVFSNPSAAKETRTFRLRTVEPPEGYEQWFEKIVLVERLREVRALIGFTRIQSSRDFDTPFELPPDQRAPISRRPPTFVPSSETRGEGIFFQFSEQAIEEWMKRIRGRDNEFLDAHARWRASRGLDPSLGFPGTRYILLHSFAHAVIRQLSVECGYNTASIAERIYSRSRLEGDPMAGVLIYTSAPDSEGTLGGLCALGHPKRLGGHLDQALERTRLCASDPLCAEHDGSKDATLHAAACHACSFLPETSCERGNKYLDRAVLVATVERSDLAFFEPGAARPKSKAVATKPTPVTKESTDSTSEAPSDLGELLDLADERCHEILRKLQTDSRPMPIVGYELADEGGRVAGQAELAWPDHELAVLLPDDAGSKSAFEKQGWTVFEFEELEGDEILNALSQ